MFGHRGPGQKWGCLQLLLLKMEEEGAKNQHQAGLWEGCGVKITPQLWGVHSAMPPET